MLAQADDGPREGEKLNQSLVHKHFVPIDQWEENSSVNHLRGKK